MRTEDLLVAVREARRRTGNSAVELVAMGSVGVPALHAAFCEPESIRRLTLDGTIASWDAVVRADRTFGQLMNTVHGALKTYDLPDLIAALGTAVEVRSAAGPTGVTPNQITLSPEDRLPERPGLSGVRFGSPNFVNVQAVDAIRSGEEKWDASRGHDWSARWIGFLVPGITGTIAFSVETNEEATIHIGDRASISASAGSRAESVPLSVVTGQPLPFTVEFNKPRRAAELDDHLTSLRILWKNDQGEWQPVPAEWLRHSRAQDINAEMSLR
jgi:hypothetical protein